ncbi:hypothetical protein A8C32_14775 [Flavivirga aquatica]|uniref:Undecaprenyl-phosphate alpha-N-acetylglucosaminyl 1-phosphate transferase n=1 Tax=Flavivirga aquatica TaxID=1849968 RepID=A0A1E5T8P8_9FLAO|nr:MraY family glycosyltransferase [Flavivirga aquatica]OEK07753.1 hypothetical protein A8C32_14775 [Flavivirga aquatica]
MNIITNTPIHLYNNSIEWIIASLCLSAIVSYYSYPIIIKISKIKELMQEPGNRSSHIRKTPNLGGIGIFLGIVTVLTFLGSIMSYNNLLCLIGALILLFFTGLKDDLVELSPINKLFGQIIASLCIIIITDIRIHSFFGIFGIDLLPYTFSIIFTLFVFILVINAFNLIDGVDGLAGCLGIISSILFGVFFFFNGNDSILFISLSLIGALATFLIFNFSKTKKVFMGDTGSMIVGFLITYQSVSFLRVYHNVELFSSLTNPPVLVIAILSFPLMDTLRVFIIRLINKRNPFSADKNHIHHNLLSLGFKHWEISLIASVFIVIMAALAYKFNDINPHLLLFVLMVLSFIFSITPFLILKMLQINESKFNSINSETISSLANINKKPYYSLKLEKVYNSILNIFLTVIIYLSL